MKFGSHMELGPEMSILGVRPSKYHQVRREMEFFVFVVSHVRVSSRKVQRDKKHHSLKSFADLTGHNLKALETHLSYKGRIAIVPTRLELTKSQETHP